MKNNTLKLSVSTDSDFSNQPFYDILPEEYETLEFQLASTDHLSKNVWFRDDQDYKVGISHIGIIALASGIPVLAFILMSNHIHLVLQCSKKEAKWFVNELKRRYSEYLNHRYGTNDFLRRIKVDVQQVRLEDESVERSIAYTLMNSVAANICLAANDYPWSSAGIYFRMKPAKGIRSGDIPRRTRMRMLHSKIDIPEDTLISEDGYILPESFIPVKFVESVFRTPKRMKYFLDNSSKAKKRLANEDGLPSFSDQVIISAIPDLCRSLFRKRSFAELEGEEMVELIKQVRRRFSADIHQISRVVGVGCREVLRKLESF